MNIFDKFKHKKVDSDASVEAPVEVVEKIQETAAPVVSKSAEQKTAEQKTVKAKAFKGQVGDRESFGVLIRPLITEKATTLGKFNQYAFAVSEQANKLQVASAVANRYGVKPVKVRIINNRGRRVRYGRTLGVTKSWKKALVTLPEGKSIQLHEGV